MNNQEAIEVMFNEWKCIDRNDGINCDRKCESCDLVMDVQTIREAFNMAISALQAQEAKHSTESSLTQKELDTISRQAALDALRESRLARNPVYMTTAMQVIEGLPSAEPEIEKRKEESAQNVPKEDLISRKAAIDAMGKAQWAKERLMELPSAQPEPCDDAVSREAAIDAALSAFSRGLLASPDIRKLPSVQPEPHWIPVSERLPDMWDERYLVSLAWVGIGVMEYKSTGFHNYGSFAPVPIESITAWMPLPEPYRVERRTDEANDIT